MTPKDQFEMSLKYQCETVPLRRELGYCALIVERGRRRPTLDRDSPVLELRDVVEQLVRDIQRRALVTATTRATGRPLGYVHCNMFWLNRNHHDVANHNHCENSCQEQRYPAVLPLTEKS